MAERRRVERKGLWALLLPAVAMSAAPAAAASSHNTVHIEVPPGTAVAQVDVPPVPVPVPVVETPLDQLLPPVTVPPGLPSVGELVEPVGQVLVPPPPPGTGTPDLPSTPDPAQGQQLQPGVAAVAETGSAAPTAASTTPTGPSEADGSQVVKGPEALEADLGRQALRTASELWFALVISGALVAFLTLQWFVDRRDPKLAVSPLSDEVLGFS